MKNNFGRFLHKRALLGPDRPALVEVERERAFTYAELDARASRFANAMRSRGIGHGDRVAVLMMNGVEYADCFFGLARIGAIMVPLNWRLVPDELEFILGDSGAMALVFDGEFDESATALHERQTPIEHWIRVGEGGPAFAEGHDAALAAAADTLPDDDSGADDALFIMYTSGTTGLPKGVVHTHDTMTWSSLTILMTADLRADDSYLQVMPLFHVGALAPLAAGIHRGARIVVMRQFDPARIFPLIEQEKINNGLAVPAMLNFMLAANNHADHDYSSLRWMQSGAAPVPVPLIEKYSALGIPIHQVYGMTETGGPACLITGDDAVRKVGSTGRAFFHTDVRVVDGDGNDIAPGGSGEVIMRGPHIMKEYWNRPDATAETLRDGWLYSGDMASIDEDGFIYIQDRKKDMIISGGENVYPAEVESVLMGHPDIGDVAVIGQPSDRWGESGAAIVVRAEGSDVTAEAILDWVNGKLARFKQPKTVVFTDTIPRNPSGKILKRELREQYPGPAPE